MKVLVTGAHGQAGSAIVLQLHQLGFKVDAASHAMLDIANPDAVASYLQKSRPDFIVNAAGMNDIYLAERQPERCRQVNQEGPVILAREAEHMGIGLLHLSCALVFDGLLKVPYKEDDPIRPVGMLGEAKWLGEEGVRRHCMRHIILRSHWLFSATDAGEVAQVLRDARTHKSLPALVDHIGQPTAAADLARVVGAILQQLECGVTEWGTYHYGSAEYTSRYGFYEAILAQARQFIAITCDELESLNAEQADVLPARPNQTRLDCRKIRHVFGIGQRPWRQYLQAMLTEMCDPMI
ncbi:NAD(P)-dependent oxidoreductase [Pokkaliibacter plantistimulans]|uniref:dTDP-4-dehydrorhamnose reductase n=1 Tax=Proteobacteria bacterium 228 TaxID=2083153 RepID=A0A2S5KWK3_9PROT|nr:NAD(P)-dependent oxidoreductase [Pokkaliibacter plantistimulans]PPC79150.1 NAD(P)-dependent oxidoreductase [Pokkaliibacter plantistimulans]